MMRNMDDHDHSSLVEALLSGFVNKKDNVDAQYEPTLIANHDGRTMEYAIKDELQRSQGFRHVRRVRQPGRVAGA